MGDFGHAEVPRTVLVAEENEAVREGLCVLVEALYPHCTIAVCSGPDEVARALRDFQIDLVVTDFDIAPGDQPLPTRISSDELLSAAFALRMN